jgi:peptidoglycan/LPS O-acetylase OafA/YrhL
MILYTLAGRPSFALFLGWVTFACETGHADKINAILGHKMFVPLSKLTFCAYLLHPLLLQSYYLSRPTAFHFTHSFQLLYMFFVAVFVSYGAALLFSLAFELPVMHIDGLVFGGGAPQRQNEVRRNGTNLELENAASEPMLQRNGTEQ